VHLVGFIIRIYHGARSSECQNKFCTLYNNNNLSIPILEILSSILSAYCRLVIFYLSRQPGCSVLNDLSYSPHSPPLAIWCYIIFGFWDTSLNRVTNKILLKVAAQGIMGIPRLYSKDTGLAFRHRDRLLDQVFFFAASRFLQTKRWI
jgi:hypothetical protein